MYLLLNSKWDRTETANWVSWEWSRWWSVPSGHPLPPNLPFLLLLERSLQFMVSTLLLCQRLTKTFPIVLVNLLWYHSYVFIFLWTWPQNPLCQCKSGTLRRKSCAYLVHLLWPQYTTTHIWVAWCQADMPFSKTVHGWNIYAWITHQITLILLFFSSLYQDLFNVSFRWNPFLFQLLNSQSSWFPCYVIEYFLILSILENAVKICSACNCPAISGLSHT